MNARTFTTFLTFLVTVSFLTVGCGGSNPRTAASPFEAFEKGKGYYESGDFDKAVLSLNSVFDFGRAHEYAADAQYLLAEAHFQDENYILAANEYERFMALYSGDERLVQAEYQRALSYYELSPAFDLDQSDTEKAITYLRLFLNRNREHPLAIEVGNKIDELQSKQALKEYEAGKLYHKREQYLASAIQFERVLDKFPNTEYAAKALVGAMQAYVDYSDKSIDTKKKERLDSAVEIYNRLVQLFPGREELKEAESIFVGIESRLAALKS